MVGFERIREVLDSVRARVEEDRPLDYAGYAEIAAILGLPPEYLKGEGIFREWEKVVRYYDDVYSKLQEVIPASMEMPSVHEEKTLCGWLFWTRYFPREEVEFQRARWFAFAVADIRITPLETYDDEERVDVEITFTPEFAELVEAEREKRGNAGDSLPKPYTMTRIMEDFCRRRGVDERDEIRKALDESAGESFDAAFLAGFDSDTQ